jgi:hypothetical protein
MSAPLFGIYGASGCGRGIMPLARDDVLRAGVSPDRIVFIEDAPQADSINGHRVMSYAEFKATEAAARCNRNSKRRCAPASRRGLCRRWGFTVVNKGCKHCYNG